MRSKRNVMEDAHSTNLINIKQKLRFVHIPVLNRLHDIWFQLCLPDQTPSGSEILHDSSVLTAEQNSCNLRTSSLIRFNPFINNWFNCPGSTMTCKNLGSGNGTLFSEISKNDQFCIEQAIINTIDKVWDFDLYRWEKWREFAETLKNCRFCEENFQKYWQFEGIVWDIYW